MNRVERTEALQRELENHGYKLLLKEIAELLKGKLPEERLEYFINNLKKRKVSLIGSRYDAPTMVAYGIMRLNNEHGFYISHLKLKTEGH